MSAHPPPTAFDPMTASLEPGVSLVEASAGTGKTFSITQLVLRLLLDRTSDGAWRVGGIGNILVVTFTNAATAELTTRVRATLRDAVDVFSGAETVREGREHLFAFREQYGSDALPRLREALASLDQLSIHTIHGWSRRVLEENALESGTPFAAQFLEEDAQLLERMAQDWWRRTMYEDEQLAALAVRSGWTHDAYLPDLKKWQRLPDVRLAPDEELPAARAALDDAIGEFAATWNAGEAREFLSSLNWRANAPLKSASGLDRAIAAGTALARGELASGMALLNACTSAAIRHEKTGIKVTPREQFEAVGEQPFVRGCDAIARALGAITLGLRVSCLRDVQRRVDDEKRRRHLLGFDDLLRRLDSALKASGPDGALARAIRARHDAALIDEFQDTDPFQFPIFATAFAGRPLFLIGDPKQAIYGFRGADLFAYLDAARHAERRYTLGTNWRSTGRLIGAVNALFARRRDPFLYDRIGFTPATAAQRAEPRSDPLSSDGRGAIHWWLIPPADGARGPEPLTKGKASELVRTALVREVVRLLTEPAADGAPLEPAQLAVLVRTTPEGLDAQAALRAAGVPCIVAGLDDILRSRELQELEGVLRAVLAPADARVVRGALATEMWGRSASAIHALSHPDRESEWQALVERLVGWRDLWLRHGFMRAVQALLAELGAVERLLAHDDGERRVTNLRHAVELLHHAAAEERLSPEGLLLWIANTRATGAEKSDRTALRLETDADAVQIVTIHRSKGLEYDVVFCPGLWATRRPSASEAVLVHEPDGTTVFDHGSAEREARGRLAAAEELAEELRVAYVAMTRARLRCYVAWGAVKNKQSGLHAGHTALGYLLRSIEEPLPAEEMAERVPKAFEDALPEWDAPLRELVARNEGAMSIELLGEEQELPLRWTSASAERRRPECRTDLPSAEQLRSWRMASFTSLTAGHQVDDARDLTDAAEGAQLWAAMRRPAEFVDFPAGREPGVALHELLERADFDADDTSQRALATEVLQRAQLVDHDDRIVAVTSMLRRVLGDTLPDASFSLRDVPRARTLREWSFYLPLGEVNADAFAEAFARKGDDLARRYAPALRRLSAERTHGFLTGVVDLAFERDGRWYLVDWKSNQLGREGSHYERGELEREMFASHYVLQYHLYVTALHRFLALRVAGYDYDTHMGGVWYAFLRGIDGTGRGWFNDRPPRALITALDALMTPVDSPAMVHA